MFALATCLALNGLRSNRICMHAHILLQEVRPVHDICIGLKTGSPLGLPCGDHLLVNQAPHLHCIVHVPHFGYLKGQT